jgi:hypothetical protein
MLFKDIKDILADLRKLSLNLLPVSLDHGDLGFIALALLFLLDGGDDTPTRTASADHVLVGDGQEIAFFHGQLLIRGGNSLHVLDHFYSVGRQHGESTMVDDHER